jgi:hypothetical protein
LQPYFSADIERVGIFRKLLPQGIAMIMALSISKVFDIIRVHKLATENTVSTGKWISHAFEKKG